MDIFFLTLFEKKAAFHLWFVYSLIGIYLIAPFISSFLNKNPKKNSLWFSIIGVSFLLFNFIITYFFGYKLSIDSDYFHYPLVYFVLGYFIKNISFNNKKVTKIISFSLFIFSTVLAALLVQYFSIKSGKKAPYNLFYSYSHPLVLISSVSIFVFFKQFKIKDIKSNLFIKLIKSLSKYSFGIYLCHILVRSIVNKGHLGKILILPYLTTNPAYYIVFNVFIIFVFSYLLVLILDKITLGKLTKIIT